jgi:hypothetical protein
MKRTLCNIFPSTGFFPITALLKPCIFYLKKEEYVDRRGFHPLPVPPPIRYSSAGLNLGHSRKLQRFGDYSLSQLGSPKRRGEAPGVCPTIGII